jgi:YbbR domain-containing protein
MRFFDDFLYKIAAFLVACVLWATAQGFRSIERGFDLPVALEERPENLVITEQSAQEINLRLSGSRAAIRQAERNLLRYPLSLEGLKAGQSRISVTTDRLTIPRGAIIAARSPSSIQFTAEPVEHKRVRVRAAFTGSLPEGTVLAGTQIDPAEIEIQGARSSVRRISEVSTERIDLSRLRESATVESAIVYGYPHVWRAGSEPGTVKVRLVVEKLPEPSDGEGEGASSPSGE